MSGVELTPRESEVLTAIGQRLTNAEIAGTFYVSVRTVESHIASLRRKLGAASRAQLVEAALARRRDVVDAPAGALRGRDAELAALEALVARSDVVALTGPPGAGKSRLAREVLHRTESVPVLVALDGARPAELAGRLADALHVVIGLDNDVVNSCVVALGTREHLVVFDDADGAVEEVHELARAIARRAPGTRVIVTSVLPPVDAAGERRIGGLADRDDAVTLFRDRAGDAVAPSDVAAITRICELVDDLPLGIVLAAAAARNLSLEEIEVRLRGDLGVLERRAGSRHASLGAAIERAMDGLDPDDRDALRSLVAGPPRFALPAADVLIGRDAAGPVVRLCEASFVVPAGISPDGALYRVPSAVRTHLRAKAGSDAIATVRQRGFASWRERLREVVALAWRDDLSEAGDRARWVAANTAALLPLVELPPRERSAVVGDLAFCIEQYGPHAEVLAVIAELATGELLAVAAVEELHVIALALCFRDLRLVAPVVEAALARFGETHVHPHHLAAVLAAFSGEGERALASVAAARRLPDPGPWMRAHLLHAEGLGWFTSHPSDMERGLAAFEHAIELFAAEGDTRNVDNVRFSMASCVGLQGHSHPRAAEWAHECVRYAASRHRVVEQALSEVLEHALAVPPAERDLHPPQLEVLREHGATRCLTRVLKLLAWRVEGPEAVELLSAAVATAVEAGDRGGYALALRDLVSVLCRQGAEDEAAVAFGELTAVVGAERAREACPPELEPVLVTRTTLVLEGVGRANALLG